MRSPRDFLKPLAIGAPDPVAEIPFTPSRMIHFLDFSNEKMVAKVPDIAPTVDILLGNLEDAVPVDRKEAARAGLIRVGREMELGDTQLWTRVNALESPWVLDDLTQVVGEIGDKLDVIMVPKVEGAWDIHYVDRLLAQLEAKHGITRPILIHAILETGQGVVNLEEIATASPRMQGMSFGPADLAASRRMKTTRVGGGHPATARSRTRPRRARRARRTCRTRGTTRSPAWSTPARAPGSSRSTARTATSRTSSAARRSSARPSCSAASAPGRCTRSRSTSPRRSSRPTRRGRFAKKVIEAIPDGRGRPHDRRQDAGRRDLEAVQGHGRPRRDAGRKDPELAEAYGAAAAAVGSRAA
jgi:malyl-CoA/(S)-citramalyl-CoA lyase